MDVRGGLQAGAARRVDAFVKEAKSFLGAGAAQVGQDHVARAHGDPRPPPPRPCSLAGPAPRRPACPAGLRRGG